MKTIIDKANTRGYFNHGWLKTYHTFSFANYYNPRRIHFGALRVLNDDTVAPGEGFGMHPHKNMEVVSIPLQGYLRHGDNVQNDEGGNLAASKIRNLECPNYEICLIDYGCGKFNRKIHIMEQYP